MSQTGGLDVPQQWYGRSRCDFMVYIRVQNGVGGAYLEFSESTRQQSYASELTGPIRQCVSHRRSVSSLDVV